MTQKHRTFLRNYLKICDFNNIKPIQRRRNVSLTDEYCGVYDINTAIKQIMSFLDKPIRQQIKILCDPVARAIPILLTYLENIEPFYPIFIKVLLEDNNHLTAIDRTFICILRDANIPSEFKMQLMVSLSSSFHHNYTLEYSFLINSAYTFPYPRCFINDIPFGLVRVLLNTINFIEKETFADTFIPVLTEAEQNELVHIVKQKDNYYSYIYDRYIWLSIAIAKHMPYIFTQKKILPILYGMVKKPSKHEKLEQVIQYLQDKKLLQDDDLLQLKSVFALKELNNG